MSGLLNAGRQHRELIEGVGRGMVGRCQVNRRQIRWLQLRKRNLCTRLMQRLFRKARARDHTVLGGSMTFVSTETATTLGTEPSPREPHWREQRSRGRNKCTRITQTAAWCTESGQTPAGMRALPLVSAFGADPRVGTRPPYKPPHCSLPQLHGKVRTYSFFSPLYH